jgi:phosphopantothenoylcysteine decarboxylase/phosphopantothenate--cysteine ligase
MAAAVADFRPSEVAGSKVKKAETPAAISLELVPTTDILASIVSSRAGSSPLIVGFAAETGDASASVLEHGRAKLARKRCDLLVVNDVSPGKAFGSEDNEVVILGGPGEVTVSRASKAVVADAIWDAVLARIPAV